MYRLPNSMVRFLVKVSNCSLTYLDWVQRSTNHALVLIFVIFLLHCFQHTIETDRRDDPVDPYKGYYTRVVQKFAGLGGDTVFGKAEIHSALYHQIWNDLVNM